MEPSKNVMVTGSTGFVGKHLTRQLLNHDYNVQLLVRTPSKADEFKKSGATIIPGDLTDPQSLKKAMEGVQGVFHLAALYKLGGQPERMWEVNVEGTKNVLDTAREMNIEKIVYCGSDTSLGNTKGNIAEETKSHDGQFRSTYERTKHEAHKLVNKRIHNGEPIVNSIVSSVYGPEDNSPIAKLIENHVAGFMISHLDSTAGYTFTHVEDVATALRLSYEKGTIGESYLISGTPATFENFFSELSEITNRAEPLFEIPETIVKVARPVVKQIASFLGKSPRKIDEMIDMGKGVTRFFSGDKARKELNWNPRSLKKGLQNTLPYYQQKESEKSNQALQKLRPLLGGLAVFDLVLGITVVVFPDTYINLMHGSTSNFHSGTYMLTRTGTLWLVFSLVQGVSALEPSSLPGWVTSAGILRLMDVPADPVYYLTTENFTKLGALGLLSAPIFNLVTGSILTFAGYRALRSSGWATLDA